MILEDSQFLVKLAKFGGDCKGMCKDCAVREGSEANNDEKAVEAAHEALICAGYISAIKYISTLPKEEPYVYEYRE